MGGFGKALRALRTRAGLRQEEVDDAAGISRGNTSRYETEAKRPSFATLEKVLAVLGADLYDLGVEARRAAGGELPMNGESGSREGRLRLTEAEWAQLEEEARATAVQMVRKQMRGMRGGPGSPGAGE